MAERLCRACGNWHDLDRPWPAKCFKPAPARSDLPFPMLISDEMPACEHVDGKFYTSKAAYRQVTRAHGLTEVGTEKLNRSRPKMPKAKREAGINAAVEKAFSRVF